MGGLGWRPAEFWSATLTEYFEACNGFNDANGARDTAPPSDREMAALIARYG